MKDKFKHAMKPTPERFRYTVQAAVDEAIAQGAEPKKRHSKGWRIVIAIALIAAILPSAVFGASKLYSILVKPVDRYGLAVGMNETEMPADYPQYVKIHVKIPDGFAVVPNTYDLKYHKANDENALDSGFSLVPMRYENADQQAYIANVDSYQECVVAGRQAYHVMVNNIKGTWEQLYVYFEDVNVMLLIFHKDVTEQQLSDFVGGISFTEGTADDHTFLNEPHDERKNYEVTYKYEESFVELPSDTMLTFKHYSSVTNEESQRYTAQIANIRITDSINGLDESGFNQLYAPDMISQTNGMLATKEFRTFNEGDGFNIPYEELSCEQKEQKLILTEITYENLCGEDISLYIPYRLRVMNKDAESKYTPAESIDPENHIYSTACCDTEITYLSPHGEGKSFYITTLPARETMTVTVGFRCNADMLDHAYLAIDDVNSIINPSHEGVNEYLTYLIKVQQDD